jgi:hypothetical protein
MISEVLMAMKIHDFALWSQGIWVVSILRRNIFRRWVLILLRKADHTTELSTQED